MRNYVAPGRAVPVTAPANVSVGGGVLVGDLFGIATSNALAGQSVDIYVDGVIDLPKEAGVSFAEGQSVRWDTGTEAADDDLLNAPVGVAHVAAAGGDTTVRTVL